MYISDEFMEMGRDAVRRGLRMNLKKDGVFKAFFTSECKESDILRNLFISAVIGKKVVTSVVTNPELLPDFRDGKVIRLDVLCELSNGEKVDIEMQMCNSDDDQIRRTVYYASRLCAKYLKSGERYESIPNVYQIMICNFNLLKDAKGFHQKFTFRNEMCQELSDTIQIHIIELPKLEFVESEVSRLSELEFFGILFKFNEDDKIASLLKKENNFKEIIDMSERVVNKLSAETAEWAKQYVIECAIIEEGARMATATKKGLEQGIEQGIEKGKSELYASLIKTKLSKNKSYEQIAEELELSVEEVRSYEKN